MLTSYDGLWGIGELAARAGATVKTVRFYSDRGLLPEAARTAGGHRRYDSDALDRLRLIRSLRALGLSVPEVRRVLDEEDTACDESGSGGGALEDAVAGRLRELGNEIGALRWREAALRLVQESTPGDRADRLRLIGRLSVPPSTAPLVRFWRGWLPPRMPRRSVDAFLDIAVPQPPQDPAPSQVLAFARLSALTIAPCPGAVRPQPAAHRAAGAREATLLYAGLAESYELAGVQIRRERGPRPGEALDSFVDAYTHGRTASGTARSSGADWPGSSRATRGSTATGTWWPRSSPSRADAPNRRPAQPTTGCSPPWQRRRELRCPRRCDEGAEY